MKEDHGIKNTKELLKLGSDLAKVLKEAKENDGKFDVSDLPLLIGLAGSFGPAMDDVKLVVPEFKDMDGDEAKELLEYLGKEIGGNFTDKELLNKINKSIAWGVATAELIKAF